MMASKHTVDRPYVFAGHPQTGRDFKPERDFKTRVILLNRDFVLTEQTPADFATEHNFELLADDQVAVNRLVSYKVELFEPRADFAPAKPFKTRLKWRDLHGNEQSKLLLTEPAAVLALTVEPPQRSTKQLANRPARRRRQSREAAAVKQAM
jgi:hypothetical protein